MITTIPADWIIMFILGMIFSLGAFRNIDEAGAVLMNKYFAAALVYLTIFCMPIAIYCYVVFPDWCWMYWLDSGAAPFWLVFSAFLFYYVFFACGFVVAFFLGKRKMVWALRGVGIASLIFIVFAAVNYKRLFFVGSIEEFGKGSLLHLFQRPALAIVVTGGMTLALAALIVILAYFGTELDHHLSQEELELRKVKRRVSVERIDNDDVRGAIDRSLEHWGGLDYLAGLLKDNKLVLIKPNLAGGGKDKPGSQTSPEVIGAVIDIIRGLQPDARILIGESGSIIWWNLKPLLEESKYKRLFEEKKCEFVDLSRGKRVWHDFGGRMGREVVSEILLRDPLIIDLPVAKTHAFYRMTGAVKNMFGILPVPFKLLRYHVKGVADYEGRVFLDIYRNFPPHLVVIDGNITSEGHGPVAGRTKRTGFIVTSDDALAADMVLAGIMGFKSGGVPYLRAAAKEGMVAEYDRFGLSPEEVVSGEWKKVKIRTWGLFLNTLATIVEHIKAARHG